MSSQPQGCDSMELAAYSDLRYLVRVVPVVAFEWSIELAAYSGLCYCYDVSHAYTDRS